MPDFIPWNDSVRILNTVSSSNNILVGFIVDSVNNSVVDKESDIFYLNWSVFPLRSEWAWIKSSQVTSAWGNIDAWVSSKEVITIIDDLSAVNNPFSFNPIDIKSPSVGASNDDTLIWALWLGFDLNYSYDAVFIINNPTNKLILSVNW